MRVSRVSPGPEELGGAQGTGASSLPHYPQAPNITHPRGHYEGDVGGRARALSTAARDGDVFVFSEVSLWF